MTVGPEMADKTNPGSKGSPIYETHLGVCCDGGGSGTNLARRAFVLSLYGPSCLRCIGSSNHRTARVEDLDKLFPSVETVVMGLKDTLRQSSKRVYCSPTRLSACPEKVLHSAAILKVDCLAFW